jgi:PAS domain S-box-containing protein
MMRRRALEALGLAIAVATLLAVAVLDYQTTEALVDAQEQVEHTRRVMEALDDILLRTTAAARFRRAYALVGDPRDASRADAAVEQARSAVARVRKLTLDNAHEQEALDRLEPLLVRRFADIRAALEATRTPDSNADTEDAHSRQSNVDMRSIAAQLDDMGGYERHLLEERHEASQRKAVFVKSAGAGGTGLGIALILLVFAGMRMENKHRRAAQQAADRATAFLDSIFEHIPDMIFVKEATALRFERINRAGEALFGKPREELIGRDDFSLFPIEQAEFFRRKDRETLERGSIVDIDEEPISTPNGTRWLHTKKVPLLGDGGEPRYVLGISADITERKQTAEALRTAVAAAQAANGDLEAFSYSVAHDLRAPLRAIDGFSQALLEDCGPQLDQGGLEHLGRVRAAAQRMGELIDSLLAVSRITRAELRSEDVDMSVLAASTVEDLRTLSPGRDVEVRIQPSMRARGDPRLLRVVLDNLFGNAFKFTSSRSHAHIEFGAAIESGERAFFVRDDGVGFDPRYSGKLFRAFQRLHSARDFPGTGIGLTTVQRVIQRHGGRVWARGEPDHGATFFFTLDK